MKNRAHLFLLSILVTVWEGGTIEEGVEVTMTLNKKQWIIDPFYERASRKFEWYKGNATEEYESEMLYLQVAATFHHNTIKCFWSILYSNNDILNLTSFASLKSIYEELLKKNTGSDVFIQMLPSLSKESMFDHEEKTFELLFSALKQSLPQHLKKAAAHWLLAIQAKEINVEKLIFPSNSFGSICQLYENLPAKVMADVLNANPNIKIEDFHEMTLVNNYNKYIMRAMRFVEIYPEKITQRVVADVIRMMPDPDGSERCIESRTLLSNYLEQNEVPGWAKFVKQYPKSDGQNPEDFVGFFLERVIWAENVPVVIKNLAHTVKTSLVENDSEVLVEKYFDLKTINFPKMLMTVEKGKYPRATVIAAGRLLYAYLKKDIHHQTLVDKFNPYAYNSNTEVFLALLHRIITRQPNVNHVIIQAAKNVYGAVSYRYLLFHSSTHAERIQAYAMSLAAPDLPQDFNVKVNSIEEKMGKKFAKSRRITETAPYDHEDPLMKKLDDELLEETLLDNVKYKESYDTQVSDEYLRQLYEDPNLEKAFKYLTGTAITGPRAIRNRPKDRRKFRLEDDPNDYNIKDTFSLLLRKRRVNNAVPQLPQLFQMTPTEHTMFLTMQDMLKKSIKTTKSAGKFALIELFSSEACSIVSQGPSALDSTKHFTRQEFYTFAKRYCGKLKAKMTELMRSSPERELTKLNLVGLLTAVAPPTNNNESRMFETLHELFRKPSTYKNVKSRMKITKNDLKGPVLTKMFGILMHLQLEPKERKAVEYFHKRVYTKDFGRQVVEFLPGAKLPSVKVDVSAVFEQVINIKALPKPVQNAQKTLFNYLKKNPNAVQFWHSGTKITSATNFVTELLEYLANKPDSPKSVKEACSLLLPYVEDKLQPVSFMPMDQTPASVRRRKFKKVTVNPTASPNVTVTTVVTIV